MTKKFFQFSKMLFMKKNTWLSKKGTILSKSFLSSKSAFTLVELIIVIAIIAILAVFAFLSIIKWMEKSRNTVRIWFLKTLQAWLDIGYSDESVWKWFYPDISNQEGVVSLLSGNVTLWYQWIVDEEIANKANLETFWIDPVDGVEYTYMVTKNRRKFQLMTMLENADKVSLINKTYALDYNNRTPYTLWIELGVLIRKDKNIPIQFVGWLTWINLSIEDTNYEGILDHTKSPVTLQTVMHNLQVEGWF